MMRCEIDPIASLGAAGDAIGAGGMPLATLDWRLLVVVLVISFLLTVAYCLLVVLARLFPDADRESKHDRPVRPSKELTAWLGARVRARAAIHYQDFLLVAHEGDEGLVEYVFEAIPYVRWDRSGETYPAAKTLLERLS